MRPVKLLHITDLHLTPVGREEVGDFKVDDPEMRRALIGDESHAFISRLMDQMVDLPGGEADWPKIIIVTGDLVESGGSVHGEMEAAAAFLYELASRLRIVPERVLVVPGNHDVDWTPGKGFKDRFENFRRAFKPFTTPTFEAEGPIPRIEKLPKLAEGIDVEVALLVSPTFSGVPDPDAHRLFQRIYSVLDDWPSDQLDRLTSALKKAAGSVDIAAIGAGQLDVIRRMKSFRDGTGPIRIAILHHHLLPDPQLEVATFESVLDAGRVLDTLLEKDFDLVLNGHKHNRRLVHYSRRERNAKPIGERRIDIYSGPSLFKATHVSQPGFTMIEIFGPDSPAYARLEYHATRDARAEGEPHELMREGRVIGGVIKACMGIPPKEQASRVVPLLEHVARVVEWSRDSSDIEPFLSRAWEHINEDIAGLAERQVVFRPPQLHERWADLLSYADRGKTTLRLVSEDDFDYWLEAMEDGSSEAAFYEAPVRSFTGGKQRILILSHSSLDSPEKRERAAKVIDWMKSGNIVVRAIHLRNVPGQIPRDFGLIANIAVSEFVGGQSSPGRALRESFDRETLRKFAKHWETLIHAPRIWSTDSAQDFETWAQGRPRRD